MAIKASLRSNRPANTVAAAAAAVTAAPQTTQHVVEVEGVQVECTDTVATPLENIIPDAEAQDSGNQQAAEETSTAVAHRPNMSVGRPANNGEGFEGDWGSEDLKFPQLKIVQGSGPLSAQFDNGTIIYADQELLPAPSVKEGAKNPVLRIVPIHIKKQWREKLDKEAADAGEMPRVVNSRQEVEELGGTTQWIGGEKPSWDASARCLFLVEQPSMEEVLKFYPNRTDLEEHPAFCLELDGKNYAVALYYAGGGAYKASAQLIYNTSKTSLLVPSLGEDGKPQADGRGRPIKRVMLWKCFWTMGFRKVPFGNYQPWHPVMRLQAKAETGPDVRAYCASLMQGTGEEAAEAGE